MNALYHNELVNGIREGKGIIKMSAEDKDIFLRAADTFKNANGEFFNQAVYESSVATLFEGCFESLNECFNAECAEAVCDNKPAPWFVRDYIELLLSNGPDVIGFSIMFPQQVSFSILAARMLKAANENIKIVFGGHSSTVAHKELLGYASIDFVVLDEGEKAFLDLLGAV